MLEAKIRQMGRAGQGLPNMFYRAAASEAGADAGSEAGADAGSEAEADAGPERFDLFGEGSDVDSYSDVNTEAEERARAEFARQEQNANPA